MSRHRSATDWAMLLFLALVWGTSFLFTKTAVAGIPAATVAAGRLTIAAIVLGAIVYRSSLELPPPGKIWAYFAVMALIGNALPFYLITWGQASIDSGLAGVLMAVMPLATLLLAHRFVAGERMTRGSVGGFVVGFLGIVVLMGPEALLRLGGSSNELTSQLAVLSGALCYAVNTIIARRTPESHVLVVSAAVMALAAAMMIPVSLFVDSPWAIAWPSVSLWSLLWLGLTSTALAMVIYFRLIMTAGPTFLSLINYLIPIVAVICGVAFLGERLQWNLVVALVLVLAGIAGSQLGGSRSTGSRSISPDR